MIDRARLCTRLKLCWRKLYRYFTRHKDFFSSFNSAIQVLIAIGALLASILAILAISLCTSKENSQTEAAPPGGISTSNAPSLKSSNLPAEVSGNGILKDEANVPPPYIEKQSDAGWIAWRDANLGERPDLPAEFDRDYPNCIADLRSRPINESGPGDTEACRLDLEAHRSRYLVPLYTRRGHYGRSIINERTRLYNRVRSDADNLLLDRINQEDQDVNHKEGSTYQAFRRADQRVTADIELCVTNRCHPAR